MSYLSGYIGTSNLMVFAFMSFMYMHSIMCMHLTTPQFSHHLYMNQVTTQHNKGTMNRNMALCTMLEQQNWGALWSRRQCSPLHQQPIVNGSLSSSSTTVVGLECDIIETLQFQHIGHLAGDQTWWAASAGIMPCHDIQWCVGSTSTR